MILNIVLLIIYVLLAVFYFIFSVSSETFYARVLYGIVSIIWIINCVILTLTMLIDLGIISIVV